MLRNKYYITILGVLLVLQIDRKKDRYANKRLTKLVWSFVNEGGV